MSSYGVPPYRPPVLVIGAGLLAATFDIVFACLFWALESAVPPLRVRQSVAGGILGESSFDGGAVTAAMGFALHYLIVLLIGVPIALFTGRALASAVPAST